MNNQPIDKEEINQLVKEIGEGSENAFNLLYLKMRKVIYCFLLRENANRDVIEDVIASTFLTVIEKSRLKMFYTNCFSWILTIAKNKLREIERKQINIVIDSEIIDRCSSNSNINNLSFKLEIEKLDGETQQIIYLMFYQKLKQEEIAKILKMSVSTVKRRKIEIMNHFKEFYYNEKE